MPFGGWSYSSIQNSYEDFRLDYQAKIRYTLVLSFIMKTRFFLSLLAFGFASLILISSLAAATNASSTDGNSTTEREIYFNSTVLPDHVLYPVRMVIDRVKLEISPEHEQVFMKVEYAHRRLEYAEELLKKQKEELSVSTLTKAEQYLYQAVTQARQIEAPDSVMQRLKKAVEYHTKRLHELSPLYNDANRAVVDKAIEGNEALLASMK